MRALRTRLFILILLLQVCAGTSLLLFDRALLEFGLIHWSALLVYVIVITILTALFVLRIRTQDILTIGFISAMGAFAMIADALLGLPLSGYSTNPLYGMEYLFGFGTYGTGSTFEVSLSFLILLFSAGATAIAATKPSLVVVGKK